jgi:DUF971 family protein
MRRGCGAAARQKEFSNMTPFDKTPTEIRLNKDKNNLAVAFDDGEVFEFTAEYLRVMSPSAEVQGHSPDQRKTVPGKKNVKISNIEPVGHYAIKITFDDGHDTGVYSWKHLYEIGQQKEFLWDRYIRELEEQGKSR